jgi:hypothetical protein
MELPFLYRHEYQWNQKAIVHVHVLYHTSRRNVIHIHSLEHLTGDQYIINAKTSQASGEANRHELSTVRRGHGSAPENHPTKTTKSYRFTRFQLTCQKS